MIEAFIFVAIVAAGVGFAFGSYSSYNRGFGDGWQFCEDWKSNKKPSDIIPPGTICTPENGWAKTGEVQ
jgi:hypothetical protein